ncbi:MAG TPA: TonB-dependent receptor [Bacteroidota bacterium]|nr:TonB-dependent receptor [Bacteroidota bacterium]
MPPHRAGRRILICALFVIFALGSVQAQTIGKISGSIRDSQTKEPLVGVNIRVIGTSLGAVSDIDGSYFILNIPPGKYVVQASMLGYQKSSQKDVIVNSNRTTTVDYKLSSEAIEHAEVIVEATRPDVEKEKTSTSEIIRSDDVKAIAGMRDVSDVIALAADVTDGHFRGGRSNEELYTLQGMGIVNPLDATSAFSPIMSAVEEIEVVTSGFGAQYGNAQSGVINITMKEGKSDRWRSKFELRLRAPDKKYFGPSIYDENSNPYLVKLQDPNFWRYGDASTGNKALIGWTNSSYGSATGGILDTAVAVQVSKAMWQSATARDLNRKYWNTVDYTLEGATGGPLADGLTMFMAIRSQVNNAIVPTEQPNTQQQVMGNLAFDLGEGKTLKLSGGYQYAFDNILGSGTGFYQWVWDRILGISYQKQTNIQLGARFSHALSPSTFYEVKLNSLSTNKRLGTSPWYSEVTDAVRNMETGTAIVTRTLNFLSYQNMTGKTFFYLGNNLSTFNNEKTTTVSLDASFTSQITKSHLLNAGIQANAYTLDVNNTGSIASKGSITLRQYTGKPFEAGLYAQDKMEFEGMIANIGFRWDYWNSNTDFYSNQFDPFVVPDSLGNPTLDYDATRAAMEKAKPIGRFQPRVGVSFPVTEATVFHLNYGTYMQRPSFQYVIGATQKMPPPPTSPAVSTLSNPRLEPQVTNSYDIGVMQGLGDGFTLDVSGYYKDIKDQLEQAVYTNLSSGTSYFSYFNRDYADVRGFRLVLSKRRGALTGSVNYQFGVATGKSASVSNAPAAITKSPTGVISTDVVTKVPIKDVLLNFDRTHNLIVNLALASDPEFGPKLFDAYPLGDFIISASAFARSGRPYTSPDNATDVNGLRTPAEYNTNIKVTKILRNFFGTTATLYAECFNVFDNKIFNYNYIFNTANKVDQNPITAQYAHYALDDPNSGVQYWDDQNYGSAYGVNHTFLMYDNSPRSFYFGVAIDF